MSDTPETTVNSTEDSLPVNQDELILAQQRQIEKEAS